MVALLSYAFNQVPSPDIPDIVNGRPILYICGCFSFLCLARCLFSNSSGFSDLFLFALPIPDISVRYISQSVIGEFVEADARGFLREHLLPQCGLPASALEVTDDIWGVIYQVP